jgi:hypothetical protein
MRSPDWQEYVEMIGAPEDHARLTDDGFYLVKSGGSVACYDPVSGSCSCKRSECPHLANRIVTQRLAQCPICAGRGEIALTRAEKLQVLNGEELLPQPCWACSEGLVSRDEIPALELIAMAREGKERVAA